MGIRYLQGLAGLDMHKLISQICHLFCAIYELEGVSCEFFIQFYEKRLIYMILT
jgi:hypothetical protein